MSDTTSTYAREDTRAADLLLPVPRRSPEATPSSGRVAEGAEPDFPYTEVRYAVERLGSLGLL